jgi:hypothetical protein
MFSAFPQPGILERGCCLRFDRVVALGAACLKLSLEIGNHPPEIGRRIRGKRRHSINPFRSWERIIPFRTLPGQRPEAILSAQIVKNRAGLTLRSQAATPRSPLR